jgi:hypothetical protein
VGLPLRHRRRRHAQGHHDVRISRTALQLQRLFLIVTGGVGLRDGAKVKPRGTARARGKIFKIHNGDVGEGADAAVVLDGERQRNVGDGLRFDSDENCLIVNSDKTYRVNGMWVGIWARGVRDMVALPVFHGITSNGEGCHGLVFEEEPVVRLIMAEEKDRGFNAEERAAGDRCLPVCRGGEDSQACPLRGGEQRDTVRAASQVSSLQDETLRVLDGGLEQSEGEVVEVAEIGERHVDIHAVRPLRVQEIFVIQATRVGAGGGEEFVRIREEDEVLLSRIRTRAGAGG